MKYGGELVRMRAPYVSVVLAISMGVSVSGTAQRTTGPGYGRPSKEGSEREIARPSSSFVPVDSWIYPALERLAALGYIDSAFLGLRPWTRSDCARLIEEAEDSLDGSDKSPSEANALLRALQAAFSEELTDSAASAYSFRLDSFYTGVTSISGLPLNDSYHFGQTIVNNFGRPYGQGFNQVSGFTARGDAGRFTFYMRGEYQHAPGRLALPESQRDVIAAADGTPVQAGRIVPDRNQFRLIEAYASTTLAGLEFSLGKQSLWWGPGDSGAMILSNNAEPIYMLRISRAWPFQLPSLLAYLGPIRFDSFFGRLAGHQFPPAPFFYGQKISLKPTPNLEFGFSRTVVFAGQGVTPLTFSTFFHSFFSTSSGTAPGFDLRRNPGARHASFDFSYKVPGLRRWLTLYSDSVVHDDVSPVSAPRRSAINPGFYLSHLPKLPKMDLRVEAVSTDPPVTRSLGGKFFYWEGIYRDAYTNHGTLLGSWIGREAKGAQAWLTYWLAPASTIQFQYRRAKIAKDFIPGGSTQDDFSVTETFRLHRNLEVKASIQYERWREPALSLDPHSDVATSFQVTWSPEFILARRR